jgi:hypothetical protein
MSSFPKKTEARAASFPPTALGFHQTFPEAQQNRCDRFIGNRL